MTLLTLPSLPGMAWLDRMTVSCSPSFTNRFSPRANSDSADIGSPCDPVEMTQICPARSSSMSSMSISADSGMSSTPRSRPSRTFFFMLQAQGGDLAAVGDRGVGDLLDAVQVAGEAGGDDPAPAVLARTATRSTAPTLVSLGA